MTTEIDTEQAYRKNSDGTVVLMGRRCTGCSKRFFPAVDFCDACDGDAFEAIELEPRGTLYSYSEIHVAPKYFPTPYVVGYVDFGPDLRVFGQIEDAASDLAVDCPVVPVLGPVRRTSDGEIIEGYRFRREAN